MRWSKSFIPTIKGFSEKTETVSQKLLIQAGLIRQLTAGVYTYLPLGLKVLQKIKNIVRQEMNRADAQELLLPALQPISLWKESGRYSLLGKDIASFLFTDRHNRQLLLGPTHEEVIVELIRKATVSYKDLPLILYQIQTKFRDEMRPRFGIIRGREFLMKDAYSFDSGREGLEKSYQKMDKTYHKIFDRCGLEYKKQLADSGGMGGKFSEEFLTTGKGTELEIGHIFKLGTTYSEKLGANFVDSQGKKKPLVMGCYGIGVSRLLAAVVEGNYDEDGIVWPKNLSPFDILITPVNIQDEKVVKTAEKIYGELKLNNYEVLYDDRNLSPGEKFKDGDLIGIPLRITIGKRLKEGKVDLKLRWEKSVTLASLEELLPEIEKLTK